MGGLEEIIKQINAESEAEISDIIAKAQAECERLKSEGQKETNALVEEKNRCSVQEAELVLEKMKSGVKMRQKQEYLTLKQQLISDILVKAEKKLESLPAQEYFDVLIKIAKNNAHEEEGVIVLNHRDLERVPEDFHKKLAEAGLKLTVSKNTADIENGMILDYGDIEENCTLKALIHSNKEGLVDKINQYIFG